MQQHDAPADVVACCKPCMKQILRRLLCHAVLCAGWPCFVLHAGPVTFCCRGQADAGWGCGYRNIQMQASHLLATSPAHRQALFGGAGFLPDICTCVRQQRLCACMLGCEVAARLSGVLHERLGHKNTKPSTHVPDRPCDVSTCLWHGFCCVGMMHSVKQYSTCVLSDKQYSTCVFFSDKAFMLVACLSPPACRSCAAGLAGGGLAGRL